MNKKAFTLAEILIVLAIIGIVALLTVPRVMKNYRNRLYVSQLRKLYGQISDAVQNALVEERASDFYETKGGTKNSCSNANDGICEAGAGFFLNTYFVPIKKNCGTGSGTSTDKCAIDSYTNIYGGDAGSLSGEYCIQIKSGAAICMGYNETDKRTHINVDINGIKDPNIAGRDVFYMTIEPSGLVTDYKNTSASNCCKTTSAGCLNKIMNDGWKMEY